MFMEVVVVIRKNQLNEVEEKEKQEKQGEIQEEEDKHLLNFITNVK